MLAQKISWPLVSATTLIAVWAVASWLLAMDTVPSPWRVAVLLVEEARAGELLYHLSATMARVVAAFILAMSIGAAIGILLGISRGADRLFDTWLIFALNVPALVTIVLCYVWFGLTEAAAVTAVSINKIPNVAVTIREGAKSLDPALQEMANVYRFGRWRTLRHVILPQLEPYFAAAVRTGLALIWKIVLVVELLGRGSGIGFQIQLYFQLFDIARILVYAVAFIIVIQLIEILLLQPWERHLRRWRLEDGDNGS